LENLLGSNASIRHFIKKKNRRLSSMMNLKDALFEDMQALSDDAETLGLTNVALVLEFAMDVYLHESAVREPPIKPDKPAPPKSKFLLAQVYRQAS
jgi:hypothetical protein